MCVEESLLISDLCLKANVLLARLIQIHEPTCPDEYAHVANLISNIQETIKNIVMNNIGLDLLKERESPVFEKYDKMSKSEKTAQYNKMKAMGL